MVELRRGLQDVFDFLRSHEAGAIVSENDILTATGWKPATLKTYINKNKLALFLARLPGGDFRVLRNGSALQPEDVAGALTQVTPDEMRLNKGERLRGHLDSYELVAELGRGAIGHVWQATAWRSKESVAVKVLNPRPDLLAPTSFADLRRRFEREVKNGAKLDHAALLRYLDNGEHRDHPFLVMERADHSTKNLLEKVTKLPEAEAIQVVSRCAEALHYLHGHGCVHRDVKPANLLHTPRGVVVGDLGIVRWSDLSTDFTSAGTLTHAAIQLGSWFYMAPEQQEAPHDATPASDVYALGVTWYELLAGITPPPAAFAAGRIKPPTTDAKVAFMIRRMTSYDQEARPSIEELQALLESYDAPTAPAGAASTTPKRRRQ